MDLERTIRDLGAARAEQDAVLAQAAALGTAPGEERAIAALREEMHGRSHRRPSVATWKLVALAASVLVLFGLAWKQGWLEGAPTERVWLGAAGLTLVEPAAGAHSIERFAWRDEKGPASSYELRVEGRAARAEAWSELTLPVEILHADSWTPPAELVRSWPQFLRWRVVANRSGTSAVSDWVEFSLSR